MPSLQSAYCVGTRYISSVFYPITESFHQRSISRPSHTQLPNYFINHQYAVRLIKTLHHAIMWSYHGRAPLPLFSDVCSSSSSRKGVARYMIGNREGLRPSPTNTNSVLVCILYQTTSTTNRLAHFQFIKYQHPYFAHPFQPHIIGQKGVASGF